VLVVGAGGAAAAIAVAVLGEGARELRILNRSQWRAEKLRDRLWVAYPGTGISVHDASDSQGAARGTDVIVNATYLGMKNEDPLPVPVRCLGRNTAVCDAVYRRAERPGSSGSPRNVVSALSPADGCCSTRGFRPRGSGPVKNPTCVR
jgi:shikimate 5-dehydrogenase